MGRAVHVHPQAITQSITAGVIIARISGALLAVPIAACVNAAVKYLTGHETSPAESKDTVEPALDNDDGEHPSAADAPAAAPTRTRGSADRNAGTRRRRGARCGPSAAEGTS